MNSKIVTIIYFIIVGWSSLLFGNDLEAAKELSKITNKPFYASDGWVELTKAGDVYSEKAFVKLENGEIKGTLSHNVGSAAGTEGVDFVRLGVNGGIFSKYKKVETWLKNLNNPVTYTNIENIIKNWSDDLLTKLDNVPSRNPKFLSDVEANPEILNHFEQGSNIISSKGSGLKSLELDMYALDKARTGEQMIFEEGTNIYKINTTRKNLAQMDINPQSGKIRDANGNIMSTDNVNSKGLMYVIDESGNIFIGSRGGTISYPHPTLIGGINPNVKCAGMIKFKDGRILSISNDSGHFKPSNISLLQAETTFRQIMPANSFDNQFVTIGF